MRRALSIFLVTLLSLAPFAAALSLSDVAHLPACCRRAGAHHCADMNDASVAKLIAAVDQAPGSAHAAWSTPAAWSAPATCPAFPGSMAASLPAPHAVLAAPMSLPQMLAQLGSPIAAQAQARISQARNRADRGPPQSSLA